MVAEGDMVAVRLTFSGTRGPTGERATWPEMVFTRFSAGKAAESWEVTDSGRSWGSLPGEACATYRKLARRRSRSSAFLAMHGDDDGRGTATISVVPIDPLAPQRWLPSAKRR